MPGVDLPAARGAARLRNEDVPVHRGAEAGKIGRLGRVWQGLKRSRTRRELLGGVAVLGEDAGVKPALHGAESGRAGGVAVGGGTAAKTGRPDGPVRRAVSGAGTDGLAAVLA